MKIELSENEIAALIIKEIASREFSSDKIGEVEFNIKTDSYEYNYLDCAKVEILE